MCGIVAYVGRRPAAPIVLDGLRRLEYRGYDSAGLAVAGARGLAVHKSKGRVDDLVARLPKRLAGSTAIAHTRWATHGEPSDANAHPHTDASGRIAIAHNGIIENAGELRSRLEKDGVVLESQTDSEVVAHLVAQALSDGAETLAEATRVALRHVVGTYGLAVVDAQQPGEVVLARNGSPLVIGLGERESFAASDVGALVGHTRQIVHLEDGEIAVLRAGGYESALGGRITTREPTVVDVEAAAYDRGEFAHFMLKEIHEQPEIVERVLSGRIEDRFATAHLGGLQLTARELREIRRVKVIGCGSAYYAGQLGAQLIEDLARIPADAEPASEFRYRNPVVEHDTLYVAVSQSGETFDTLAAVHELKRKGGRVVGVVNVVGSAIARECDGGLYLHAGPEISVTSTKTYTATAVVFALLALHLGRVRDLSPADGKRIIDGLRDLPAHIADVLRQEDRIAALAADYAKYSSLLFVGRVRGNVVAREGAQKLKEVSYQHAEAYPASELKHGPLALVSPDLPVVAIVPDDELLEKNIATLAEIRARAGRILAIAHSTDIAEHADDVVVIPRNEPELDPILLGIPLQLFAYHAALALGNDVDRPRNLAKSVTVE